MIEQRQKIVGNFSVLTWLIFTDPVTYYRSSHNGTCFVLLVACLSLCSHTCGSTSLMQSVMKQATRTVTSYQSPLSSRKQHSRHSAILTAVFSLLANTTVSPECRGLMRKVTVLQSVVITIDRVIIPFQFSFLDLFSTLRPKAEGAIPGRCLLFSCWLQLLVNLTRYNDGQQMVLKQPGVLL